MSDTPVPVAASHPAGLVMDAAWKAQREMMNNALFHAATLDGIDPKQYDYHVSGQWVPKLKEDPT